jgi:Family of unknown function (DUF6455)
MLMNHLDIPVHRLGGSLGAMMLALDIVPDQLAEIWHGVPFTRAIERCLSCPAAGRCAAWLRDPHHDGTAYRSFCPNAGVLDVARRR